jgi:hypothetical protein
MACVLGSAAGATEVVFRVEYVGGLDLDAARMAQVLASPETEVRITYAPVLAVPGWTGRLGICGVSRGSASVCIKKRWKSAHLEGKQIARSADSLQFRVPGWRWFGLMPYRPAGPVRVSLPAFWPGGLPVNMDADVSALSVDARPLVDMHLPVPYGGVASWQRIEKEADDDGLPPWQVAACDPAIGFGETTRPHWRQHRQADAYAEWLRALADSEWWASQIDGVVWTQGEQEGVVWRRVAVQRGGVRLEHVRVDEARLPSSHCPGHTRHEFSWQDGALMSARRQETADLFSEQPGCDAVMPVLEEALWSASRLLRYTHVDQHGQQYREAWRDDRGFANCSAAALGHTGSAAVRTDALQRAAIPWQTPGATP